MEISIALLILITSTAVILWIVSNVLLKLDTSKPELNNWVNPPVLFVVAHPDDESMFFAPTILNIMKRIKASLGDKAAMQMFILCVTSGTFIQ